LTVATPFGTNAKNRQRLKRARDQYKQRARQATSIDGFPQTGPKGSKVDVVWFSLQLFLVVHLSFRAISRVLALLAEPLGLPNTPCPQIVSNWVTRLSLARISHCTGSVGGRFFEERYDPGAIWLLDTSPALYEKWSLKA
jgi:hypothetical protein